MVLTFDRWKMQNYAIAGLWGLEKKWKLGLIFYSCLSGNHLTTGMFVSKLLYLTFIEALKSCIKPETNTWRVLNDGSVVYSTKLLKMNCWRFECKTMHKYASRNTVWMIGGGQVSEAEPLHVTCDWQPFWHHWQLNLAVVDWGRLRLRHLLQSAFDIAEQLYTAINK